VARLVDQIREAELAVSQAAKRMLTAKNGDSKAAREDYDRAWAVLRVLLDQRDAEQRRETPKLAFPRPKTMRVD
jgi:hypothetical protein